MLSTTVYCILYILIYLCIYLLLVVGYSWLAVEFLPNQAAQVVEPGPWVPLTWGCQRLVLARGSERCFRGFPEIPEIPKTIGFTIWL